MSGLTLTVRIDKDDLVALRKSKHNLCLTRSVKSGSDVLKGNVVFAMVSWQQLASSVTLDWSEEYQVFASEEFKANVKVKAASDAQDIKRGQTAVISDDSSVAVTGTPKPTEPFHVTNEWKKDANIGVNNWDTSTESFSTIYVSEGTMLHETRDLIPIQKYAVFWDSNLVTNTMFDHGQTPPFEFDLSKKPAITLQYKDNEWSNL